MSQPRLSGILNNCSLHAGVPELIQAIGHYAAIEQGRVGGHPRLNERRYQTEYRSLKTHFANFLGRDQNAVTWTQLYWLLTGAINNNSTAAQFILGVIGRRYMRDGMSLSLVPDPETDSEDTVLQPDGRYPLLTAPEVSRKFYAPLGIKLRSFEKADGLATVPATLDADGYLPPMEGKMDDEVFVVSMYNEDKAHWERLPKSQIATARSDQDQLSRDCPEVSRAFDRISSGNTKANTEAGLDLLKTAVGHLLDRAPGKRAVPPAAAFFPRADEEAIRAQIAKAKQAFETRIRNKRKVLVTPEEVQAVELKLQEHYGRLFSSAHAKAFEVPDEQKIDPRNIDAAKSLVGENDADFAKRLQEAEIRAFKLGR